MLTAPTRQASALGSVLIVEDDDDTRNALQISLMAAGHFVYLASDGEEASRAARLAQPDVVLLDLGLPGKGGLQILPDLQRVAPKSKIVVLSAFDEARCSPEAMHHGAALYLEKPIGRTRLLDAVRAVSETV
ncbi:MAG: response regulator [Planctomycetota bacterium]